MPRDDAFDRAVTLHRQGSVDRAERLYARIVRDEPGHADALHLLGVIRMSAGNGEGRRLIDRAIAIAPRVTLYRTNLAELLLRGGNTSEAEAEARIAVETAPDDCKALRVLASVLREQRRYEEACALLQRALRTDPSDVATLVDIGATLNYLGLNELSERYTRLALRVAPNTLGLWNNLGLALKGQKLLPEAIDAFQKASATPHGRFCLAQSLLLAGRYGEAWPLFEARLEFITVAKAPTQTIWTGQPLGGRTLLVEAEQGLGDIIMMSRFFAPLSRQGARVVVRAPAALNGLIGAVDGGHEVIDTDTVADCDLWIPMMSLPGRLGVDDPASVPPPSRIGVSPRRVAGARSRVGVTWRGNPTHRYDGCRSLPIDSLRPMLARSDIEWLSVYKGPDDRQQAAALGIPYALADVGSFLETAEFVGGLDLCVTVDTAIAHLSSSLGVPTIILLNKDCDWRWLAEGESAPWYPQATLIRQDVEREWSPVIAAAIAAIDDRIPPRP